MNDAQWDKYPNFSKAEFDCQETGENQMKHEFMEKLQELRKEYGKPMVISSGFRSVNHSIEKRKSKGGSHTTGLACDISVRGSDAFRLVRLAFELGFTGIGINQKGSGRFVHLDIAKKGFLRPNIWSY